MKIKNTIKPVLVLFPISLLAACAGQQTASDLNTSTEFSEENQIETVIPAQQDHSELDSPIIETSEEPLYGDIKTQNEEKDSMEDEVSSLEESVASNEAGPDKISDQQDASKENSQKPIDSEENNMATMVIEDSATPNATEFVYANETSEHYWQAENDALPKNEKFFFGFDKKELDEVQKEQIILQGEYLAKNPQIKVILHGHTDANGQDLYNEQLSVKRAEYVANLLKSVGVKDSQIEIHGWGSQQPLVSNSLYQENRRVEMEFEDMKYASN